VADDIAESYPNVRVADAPPLLDLFERAGRAKLIALLAAEKIAHTQPFSRLPV
jgi:hypothetical protein